jgi:tetratricopeptide (TPR) repeat protein
MTHLYLGMFWGIRAESLSGVQTPPDALSPEAWRLYQKSVDQLRYAAVIDRAQNAHHRSRELARGVKGEDIGDIGQPQIYQNLGTSCSRIGDYAGAVEAYRMLRALRPSEAVNCSKLAVALASAKQYEQAAIALLQATLLGQSDDETMKNLTLVYDWLGVAGAVVPVDGKLRYNLNSPVRKHLCIAARELANEFTTVQNTQMAQQARDIAKQLHCEDLK